MKRLVYLDYNATSPIRSAVIDTMTAVMQSVGNPSSVHAAGRGARAKVEEARAQVAALVNARPRDVVFTSGGTEASNTVIRGVGAASILVSAIEHDCVFAAAKESGLPTYVIPTSDQGVVDMEALRGLLEKAEKPALVSVMLANNEIGAIQDVAAIVALAKEFGARVFTDAVQAAGKIPLDFKALGVDYLSLSAHKLGGPQGVGAIVLGPTAPLKSLIPGGGQELSRRSGTENVAGIAGFGTAAMEAMVGLGDMDRIRALRDKLESEVRATANDAIVVGSGADRLANTSCLIMPGVKGETQVMHFDLNGICVSSGSACSSGKVKVSHVLTAMGFAPELAECSIRVSLGYRTTEEDVDAFVAAWKSIYTRTRAR
ncbi:cysteine desulfurase family protein [Kordiimonas lacus]|uniref:Cysteine desulfurase n=1 Tax=Kordiimonas lacus TaxID=637679 RepID=A0A1G6WX54_9PROT|nr:cysteine desulfurase family protein [Kordiimonas lacus]SDD70431.1 cysteine desulfurase [Kordiimonas lacus]